MLLRVDFAIQKYSRAYKLLDLQLGARAEIITLNPINKY